MEWQSIKTCDDLITLTVLTKTIQTYRLIDFILDYIHKDVDFLKTSAWKYYNMHKVGFTVEVKNRCSESGRHIEDELNIATVNINQLISAGSHCPLYKLVQTAPAHTQPASTATNDTIPF